MMKRDRETPRPPGTHVPPCVAGLSPLLPKRGSPQL